MECEDNDTESGNDDDDDGNDTGRVMRMDLKSHRSDSSCVKVSVQTTNQIMHSHLRPRHFHSKDVDEEKQI